MKTIAQQIKWDFEANGDLKIKDKNDNLIYREDSYRFWRKCEYDSKGKLIYVEDSDGYWVKQEWDSQGNKIYYEYSNGFWGKSVYDSQGKLIYSENSYGVIEDKRPKPCSDKEIIIEGVKYKLTKV